MKTKNFFRSKFNVFYIIALVARSYFTNATVFVSNIILPVLIYLILSLILENNVRVGLAVGIAITGVISTGVLSFAVNFFEWRNSVIYKKVKISLVSETQFFIAFFFFYLLISFVMFWFLIGFVLFYEKIKYLQDNKETEFVIKQIKSITSINWMWIFVSLFQLTLISILIGFLIGSLAGTAGSAQAIGLVIYLTAAFVTSCYISLALTAKVEFLRIYGNILPVYPSTHAIQGAWLENLIPDGESFSEISESKYGKWYLNENPTYIIPDEIKNLKWTRKTDEGLEFLNEKTDWKNPFEKYEYIKFSILGPYWGHAFTSLGWTVVFLVAITMVNKFKYNRR